MPTAPEPYLSAYLDLIQFALSEHGLLESRAGLHLALPVDLSPEERKSISEALSIRERDSQRQMVDLMSIVKLVTQHSKSWDWRSIHIIVRALEAYDQHWPPGDDILLRHSPSLYAEYHRRIDAKLGTSGRKKDKPPIGESRWWKFWE